MRPSNRSRILEAAIRIIDRDGMTALTFDAVAAESDLTRGRVIYHFESREALVLAIHQHVAELWEAELVAGLQGVDPADATAEQRLLAYVRACAQPPQRAHVRLALEPTPESQAVWRPIYQAWLPDDDQAGGERTRGLTLARLAADGLWLHEALAADPMSQAQREEAVQAIEALVRDST
ncbi:TetR/AcrR family transcriptional regulator [Parenemella sanctibonifatiensis]|uniref:TetR family transcriptional regulator n=1 Tax=Parenemella sanctibonifatiensis TaxID=2016505 RepID=A0A255E7W4_9ACTN|nr:TetR/AcrR family transcriptional regulator [Parenemella sanctibonifatiensis]OYN87649.1 TetR family transcriptional regulator [Parenemella sanctibonifatiensis]